MATPQGSPTARSAIATQGPRPGPNAAKPTPQPRPAAVTPLFQLKSFQTKRRWFKALIYGVHGMGKTEFAGTCCDVPAMCDVFMINAEKGDMTIEETKRIHNKDRLFMADCDDIAPVEQMRQWLKQHCAWRDKQDLEAKQKLLDLEKWLGMEPREDGEPRRFYTCVIDSLTEIQAFAMTQILGQNANTSIIADIPDSEWSHYNKILSRMHILIRAFRDLPMHVIYLAQEDFKQDETKKFHYEPQLMGKMAKRVQGFVDLCGYLTVVDEGGKSIRRLFIQPIGKFNAKNRMAGIKTPYIDDPHMARIAPLIGLDKKMLPSTSEQQEPHEAEDDEDDQVEEDRM